MTTVKKEVAFAVAVVALCWALKRSAPGGRIEAATFWIVLLLPILLNLVGWWRSRSAWSDGNTSRWRRVGGLLGLAGNTVALSLAWGSVFYNVFLTGFNNFRRPRLLGFKEIDLLTVIVVCLFLSVAAVIAGLVAPPRIRLAVALGGYSMASFILSVRLGVL